MYRTILTILYLAVLIPSLSGLIRHRDLPGPRRWAAGLGVGGILLAPWAASVLCQLVASLLLYAILVGGIVTLLKILFR